MSNVWEIFLSLFNIFIVIVHKYGKIVLDISTILDFFRENSVTFLSL